MFLAPMRYLIFQTEKGDSGTQHFQGYVYFKTRKTLVAAKRLISMRAHLEIARGTPEQNKIYCSKSAGRVAGPWSFGTLPKSGKRNDLLEIKQMIDSGKTNREIAQFSFGSFVRYHRGFDAYRLTNPLQRKWKTEVVIIFGPTGTGKTRFASEFCGSAYWKTAGTKWFDGYVGQDTVIFDDMNMPWFPHDLLKRLMDRTPLMVETKGGHTQWLAKRLIITCNVHPQQWYHKLQKKRPSAWLELQRRIDILAEKRFLDSSFDFILTSKLSELPIPRLSVEDCVIGPIRGVVANEAIAASFNAEKLRQERLLHDISINADSLSSGSGQWDLSTINFK